ncbi:ATP-binding protein [Paraburkholderia phosphatilytica]|uniref:ATP-binding protein n=1 Tax=Paraburkholderia phosphatilytica TaxID=2282883 RepID=UPI0013DEAE70|nr:ATP-binding protein [Paraburkholderia phosphatilytica]
MTTTETRTCAKHGVYEVRTLTFAKRHEETGEPLQIRMAHCGQCAQDEADQRAAREAAEQARERQDRIEKRFAASGIPRGFVDRTFDSYRCDTPAKSSAHAKCKAFADAFLKHLDRGTMLLLLGNTGTGKSHLAIAAASAIMARGHSAMYETAFKTVSRMRDCMRRDAPIGTAEMLRIYGEVDLLILDEIGIQAATDDVKAHLTNVIDQRYCNARPTILITNLSKADLAEYVGERIADRMRERASVIPFDWQSERTAVRAMGEF